MKFYILSRIASQETDFEVMIVNRLGFIKYKSESVVDYFIGYDMDNINIFEMFHIKINELKENKHFEISISEKNVLKLYFEKTYELDKNNIYFLFLIKKEKKEVKLQLSEKLNCQNVNYHILQNFNTTTTSSFSASFTKDRNESFFNNIDNKKFNRIKQRSITLNRVEYFIYFFNFLLLVGGVVFLIIFNSNLNYFSFYSNGMYQFRTLRTMSYVQMTHFSSLLNLDLNNTYYYHNNTRYESILKNSVYLTNFTIFQNNLVFKKFKIVESFLNDISKNDKFSSLFNEKIKYFDVDLFELKYVEKAETFINLLRKLYVYYNNLGGLQPFKTHLNIEELKTDDYKLKIKITSVLFMFQNLFKVISDYFIYLESFLNNSIYNKIDDLMIQIVFYNIVYLVLHLVIILIIVVYLKLNYEKYKSSLFCLDDQNKHKVKILSKKFKNIKKSLNQLISPKNLLSTHKKNNKKKSTNISRNKTEITNNNEKVFNNKIKKVFQSKNVYPYVNIVMIIICTYFLTVLVSLMVLKNETYNIKAITKMIQNFYLDQHTFFEIYLFLKFSSISNINLSTFNNENLKILNIFNNKEEYLNFYENKFKILLNSISNSYTYANYNLLNPLVAVHNNLTASNFCDFCIVENDIMVSQFKNHTIYSQLKEECNLRFEKLGNIHIIKLDFLNDFRNIFESLKNKSFSENEHGSELLKDITIIIMLFFRPYYVNYRENLLTPTFLSELKYFLNICIYLFLSTVILDIICLILIKYFILSKTVKNNRCINNLHNCFKK